MADACRCIPKSLNGVDDVAGVDFGVAVAYTDAQRAPAVIDAGAVAAAGVVAAAGYDGAAAAAPTAAVVADDDVDRILLYLRMAANYDYAPRK